jgi:hypothetical protein
MNYLVLSTISNSLCKAVWLPELNLCSRAGVHCEQPIAGEKLKKFTFLYKTQKFIAVFGGVCHSSLSCARFIPSTPSQHAYFLKIHFYDILHYMPRSSKRSPSYWGTAVINSTLSWLFTLTYNTYLTSRADRWTSVREINKLTVFMPQNETCRRIQVTAVAI